MSKTIFAILAAICVAVIAVVLDAPAQLGAHPFWSSQVVWIGLAGALALILIAARFARIAGGLAVLCFVLGGLAARFGKMVFAESFAENALAGQFWYFGWMVLCIGAIALIALVFRVVLGRARPA